MHRLKLCYLLLLGLVVCTVPQAVFADVADIDVDTDTDSDSDSDSDTDGDSDSDDDTAADTGTDSETAADGSDAGEDKPDGDSGGSDSGCSFTPHGQGSPVQFLAVMAMIIAGLWLRRNASK